MIRRLFSLLFKLALVGAVVYALVFPARAVMYVPRLNDSKHFAQVKNSICVRDNYSATDTERVAKCGVANPAALYAQVQKQKWQLMLDGALDSIRSNALRFRIAVGVVAVMLILFWRFLRRRARPKKKVEAPIDPDLAVHLQEIKYENASARMRGMRVEQQELRGRAASRVRHMQHQTRAQQMALGGGDEE